MKQGWEVKRLGDVCELINRGVSPKYIETDGLLVLNQKCIRNHEVNYDVSRVHDNTIKPVKNDKFIQIGDVLINSTGTGTLGRVAQIREEPPLATVDSHVTIVRPLKNVFYSDFFGYALILIEEEIAKRGNGCGGQTELARNALKYDFSISYPKSLPEQKRIVAILDDVFAAIARAKAIAEQNLKNAKELFESYLQGIFETKGEGWEEKKLGEITTKIGSGATPRGGNSSYKKEGISLIRSMNVYDHEFRIKNLAFIDDNQANALSNVVLKENDVLFNITGASIARCCVVPKTILPARVNQHVSIIRAEENVIDPMFLSLLLTSKFHKNILLKTGEQGATRQAITKTQLENYFIAFPKTVIEQKAIVEKLDALSAETKKLEAIYAKKIEDLEELKKSVLERAFKGEL